MNKQEFEAHRNTIYLLARELGDVTAGACTHCDHFGLHAFCGVYQSAVPVEHWQTGCDAWVYGEVPF